MSRIPPSDAGRAQRSTPSKRAPMRSMAARERAFRASVFSFTACTPDTTQSPARYNWQAAASYVTGSHNVKTGIQYQRGTFYHSQKTNGDLQQMCRRLIYWALPQHKEAVNSYLEGSRMLMPKAFVKPLAVTPPLRVLAPKPSSFASSTTASMPCLANSSAVDNPA